MNNVARVFNILALIVLVFAVTLGETHASCSSKQIAQLKAKGLSSDDIVDFCGEPDDDTEIPNAPRVPISPNFPRTNQGRLSNICFTQAGSCPLAQSGPPGVACWCASPFGPVSGMLR